MLKMTWKNEAEIYAKNLAPKEACGIVAIIDGKQKFWPCKNIADDQENFFALDPDDWEACEDKGGEIIGVFHSHPNGSSELSKADKTCCELIGYPYYVYSNEDDKWNKLIPDNWKKLLLKIKIY